MKYWKCPECKRMRTYNTEENLIMKVCRVCQVQMEIIEEKTLEAIYNGWGH